jgi:hypothetical protein
MQWGIPYLFPLSSLKIVEIYGTRRELMVDLTIIKIRDWDENRVMETDTAYILPIFPVPLQ